MYHELDRLLETLADSVAGFEHVAGHVHQYGFYAFCERRAGDRARLLAALRQKAHALKGRSAPHGTLLGSAHRLLLDLRTALGMNEKAVIEELVRGEAFLIHHIDQYLEAGHCPSEDVWDLVCAIRADVARTLFELEGLLHPVPRSAARRSVRA